MQRAISLAEMAAYSARPNPHVGCVLVRDDVIIGEGYTCPPGGNHAEIQALQVAGDARGATARKPRGPGPQARRRGRALAPQAAAPFWMKL